MRISSKVEHFLLFLGDLAVLLASLWLTLALRYQGIPDIWLLGLHLKAFGPLFILWFAIFYIAGLYEKQTLVGDQKIFSLIVRSHVINSFIAVVFFYFVPFVGISPKTNLFIYLIVSLALVLLWRLYGSWFFESKVRQAAILVGTGKEMNELAEAVNANPRYRVVFTKIIDVAQFSPEELEANFFEVTKNKNIVSVVADFSHPKVQAIFPRMYQVLSWGVTFLDMHSVYEDAFDRIPVSLLTERWFLEHASFERSGYDTVKRIMDICLAVVLGLVSLVFYPFVFLAIKIEDGKALFISQNRVGAGGKLLKIYKFRTMSIGDDEGDEEKKKMNHVTTVGRFLRKTRIDELPQLWNVLRGDVSMIGPRPELPVYVAVYNEKIPYYQVRHLIKPGLSGWAQIYHKNPPKVDVDTDETTNKLSYDLYYVKNRSFWLDIQIALKTLKIFMSQSGK